MVSAKSVFSETARFAESEVKRTRSGEWQMDPESAPLAESALHGDAAPVSLSDVLDDRQTEPGAAEVAAARLVDPIEALEEPGQVLARHADTVVAHADVDLAPDDLCRHLDHTACGTVLDRVVDEIHHGLLEQRRVDGDGEPATPRQLEFAALLLRLWRTDAERDLQHIVERRLLHDDAAAFGALFEAGESKQVLDDAVE